MSDVSPQPAPENVPPPPVPSAPPVPPASAPTAGTAPQSATPPGPASAPGSFTDDEKQWALFSHLFVLIGFIGVPFGNLIGPGIAYFVKKDQSKFVRFHAVQSFAFQAALTVLGLILMVPFFILVFLTAGILMIAWPCFLLLGFAILGYVIYVGVQAQKGEFIKYPVVGEWAYKRVWEQDWKPM